MPTQFLWGPGTANSGLLITAFNLQTTELQSLANTSVAVSSGIFNNSNTSQGMIGDLFLSLGNPGIGTALSAGANLSGWFLTSLDGGTTFESASVAPPRPPDFLIPLPATTITAGAPPFKTMGPIMVPSLPFKVLVQNNTGQTFGNGGTTAPYLKLAIYSMQY